MNDEIMQHCDFLRWEALNQSLEHHAKRERRRLHVCGVLVALI
jgi:hypothetical protein